MDGTGNNTDGANCYEPLIEKWPGDFYGAAYGGGPNGNGTVFRYSLVNPAVVETVHAFGATDADGENLDGANPYARLTRSDDGDLYSTASYGGKFGNGVVYRIGRQGNSEVLHTFSATDPSTGTNADGANPDFGVVFDEEYDRLIGMADYGGLGSVAGDIGNGTLYKLKLHR